MAVDVHERPVYHVGLHDVLVRLYHNVFESVRSQRPCYQFRACSNVMLLLAEIIAEELSVKEIAHELAFEDPYYFSRLFKTKTGVPPSRWSVLHEAGVVHVESGVQADPPA